MENNTAYRDMMTESLTDILLIRVIIIIFITG